MAHMIGSNVEFGVVDKRRAGTTAANKNTHLTRGTAVFTANGAGTTTTLVGADAAPGTNDNNVIRRGEKFRLFTSAGVLKEETVFTVTNVAPAAGTTTVTFTPAAATATASTNVARLVDINQYMDEDSLDDRLLVLGYSQSTINQMTQNDKIFAIRSADDPTGI